MQTRNVKPTHCTCPSYLRHESAATFIRGEVHLKLWPTGLGVALLTGLVGNLFDLSDAAVLIFCVMAVVPILFSFKNFFVCTACGGELSAEELNSDL